MSYQQRYYISDIK